MNNRNYPYVHYLRPPSYVYANGESQDKLRGLLRYAPLKPAHTSEPKCLFVFKEEDRDHANQLYVSLKNGIARFPGCKRLAGISLDTDSVEPVRVPDTGEKSLAQSFFRSIEDRLKSSAQKPDFAFVIYSKQPNPNMQDPYKAAKAALTKYGIPSQYISWELLDSQRQFQYAISNIALSLFVKLGGVPWSVSLKRKSPTLIFGIGKAEVQHPSEQYRHRLIGYTNCLLSSGLYLSTSFFPPADNYDQFLINLEKGLREALDKAIAEQKNVEKVTIHVSGFESYKAVDAVRNILRNYDVPISFELIRLTADSDFSVFDLSHSGYVSEEGTVVMLSQDHALMVTEGRREQSVWRGRKPVTLEMHREYKSRPTPRIQDTIEDAFCLSSVNWRGFNAITQPVSLQYATLLAQQVAKMSTIEPDICSYIQENENFNSIPWFI